MTRQDSTVSYFEDRWSGAIRSDHELRDLVERDELPRFQIARRFRALNPACCRLLAEAESVAARAAWGA